MGSESCMNDDAFTGHMPEMTDNNDADTGILDQSLPENTDLWM